MRFVIAIVSTNRHSSLVKLVHQLLASAKLHQVEPTLLVVENSSVSGERKKVEQFLREIQKQGTSVHIDRSATGDAIHIARQRARKLVETDAQRRGTPDAIWFLDDDVQLVQEYVADDYRQVGKLYDLFEFIIENSRNSAIGMMIGGVTGDPPIPPIATYASRLTDLAHQLRCLDEANESEPWLLDSNTYSYLQEADVYYDFSTNRHQPSWEQCARWLPTSSESTVATVREEVLDAVVDIPIGGSFTRPLLTCLNTLRHQLSNVNRGGNCVFFDLDLCLQHRYPAIEIDGIFTRRSDMIGSWLVRQSFPQRVATLGLSVWHQRERRQPWPDTSWLVQNLLGDTWGAFLAHLVRTELTDLSWLEHRLHQICSASSQWTVALYQLKQSRSFRRNDPRLLTLYNWAQSALPVTRGKLNENIILQLTSQPAMQSLMKSAEQIIASKHGPARTHCQELAC
jgi:hypothetical protein